MPSGRGSVGRPRRARKAGSFTSPTCWTDPEFDLREAAEDWRRSHHSRRAAASRRNADRRHRICRARRCGRSPTSRSSWSDLRRPGGDRDRERAAVRRGAGAHRDLRIAAAADRHRRCAEGHQPLDVRSADRARNARRIGGAAVRREQALIIPARRRSVRSVAATMASRRNSTICQGQIRSSGPRHRWSGARA